MAPIMFDKINVNVIETNSTISVGKNSADHWSGHHKRNFGMGVITGENYITNGRDFIIDNDKIDYLVKNPNIESTVQKE